jgi:hypothetical protein
MTADGIIINVFDRARKPVFEPQSTRFTTYGQWVFSTLAWEIARSTNFPVELEGHTESGNAPVSSDYGDWEISADRATAVRRKLLESGVPPHADHQGGRITATRRRCRNTEPADEINRRVTVLLNLRGRAKKSLERNSIHVRHFCSNGTGAHLRHGTMDFTPLPFEAGAVAGRQVKPGGQRPHAAMAGPAAFMPRRTTARSPK